MKRIYLSLVLGCALCMGTFAQNTKHLMVLHTSDTHSRIEPIEKNTPGKNANMGGTVRRIAFLNDFRAKNPNNLLFDCGDIGQGTPYYNLFKGEVEIQMMNRMKYDAITIGNHEFDFGLDNMARIYKMANFPVVCSNYDFKGTVLENIVKPYTILHRDGLKIGVFGLSPEMEGLVQAKNCEGVKYEDPVEVANKMADLLKNREHCDVVICLSHLGLTNINLSGEGMCDRYLIPRTRNIDLVLGGHSHTFMEKPEYIKNADGKEVPVMHVGKSGIYVGVYDLTFNKE